jgi:hypothetical protein
MDHYLAGDGGAGKIVMAPPFAMVLISSEK